jgi:actin-like ATPase involved in cell morphogenesis
MSEEKRPDPGVGLDCGTMNFVAARRIQEKIVTQRVRDAFIDLPPENKRMLKLSKTSFAELDGKLIVVGDAALETANLLNKDARRPMSGGVVSAGELDAQRIIALIMQEVLGKPVEKGEKCCYSVPAPAIDVRGSDVTYHSAILKKVLQELGYSPEPTNEAMAIVYSECVKENFSGLAISYGSGMTNVCLSYNAMSAFEFSLGRGGDWIDAGAAKAVGTTAARICSIKETEFDISKAIGSDSREIEAIAVYIQSLIDYTIDKIIETFQSKKADIHIAKPLPIIVSGGTSLAKGFLDKFKERFEIYKPKFPIQISEIRHAANPMTAVATGLLLLSQMDDDD